MKRIVLTAAAALLMSGSAPALAQSSSEGSSGQAMGTNAMDTDQASMPAPQDVETAKNFVPMAAVGNSFEIESSNLALTKSQDENVRNFARTMVDDHSAAAMKMKQAVEESDTGLSVPTGLDAKHQEMLNQLSSADDSEFDAMYADMQAKAHEEAVTLFTAYSQNGEDGPIKTFAANTLPTLKQHQSMVDTMQ
ncbi:DUF4142 domain-containing protein [Jiella avicenniae]|uniref:DUF4142 domain-containing protein n=1 Tax=Jiella avicenniae TaxID=2907202 RepID=A0A9X1NZZ3_9HYPH|nr:DUF4142 domain-containing protein [Jiella avicenniae]MCE7026826.1 DUF4142 domain-containing protein [Jiella avicenniae]